jgi:hypothetical protein
MASHKELDIIYFLEKDILDVIILPNRPSVVGGGDHGLLIHYDEIRRSEIVGFEILDFTEFIPHLYEPGLLPELPALFDVQRTELRVDTDGNIHRQTTDTGLRGVTLREALEWAYHTYILAGRPSPRPLPAEVTA